MNRTAAGNAGMFFGLIIAGTAVRLVFNDVPNFAPVAAIALFSGYFYRSRFAAALVPLSIMMVSDCFHDSYHWRIRAIVYSMLVLPVFAGDVLRTAFDFRLGSRKTAVFSAFSLVGASLAASIAFYLATNFAEWAFGKIYTPDFAGLINCYVQGLPFFRNTLLGDLAFSLILFGGFGLAVRISEERKLAESPVSLR